MKKLFSKLLGKVNQINRCLFSTREARNLSLFALAMIMAIVVVAYNLTMNDVSLSQLWSMYTDFVGQYIQLSTKELVALALAILFMLSDLLAQPIEWISVLLKHSFDPTICGQAATRINAKPVGQSINLIVKIIVASAIFWYFAK